MTDVNDHPRPQMARAEWTSLDGPWNFGIDATSDTLDRQIEVPYAPETPASGIEAKGYFDRCWYRRTTDVASLPDGHRLMLYFEAAN